MWYQKTLTLSAKSRGFRLVTDEILNQLADMPRVNIGLLHLLLQHTSASLTLNENCDPTVRHDMERFFLRAVPDSGSYGRDYEGADDMPSHIKSSMLGISPVLPVHKRRIQTGAWQSIWLGEHRIHDGSRRIIAAPQGERKMTISELLRYCMAKPGVEQSVYNDWKATQTKMGDVLLAMVKEVENRPAVSLRTSPELAELLRQQHSDVRPSCHLNKAHWSTVYLDGSLPEEKHESLVQLRKKKAALKAALTITALA